MLNAAESEVNASATFQSVRWHEKQESQWVMVESGKSYKKGMCRWGGTPEAGTFPSLERSTKLQRGGHVHTGRCKAKRGLPNGQGKMRMFLAKGRAWARAGGLVVTQQSGAAARVAENGPIHGKSSIMPKSLNLNLKIPGNNPRILFLIGHNMTTFPF